MVDKFILVHDGVWSAGAKPHCSMVRFIDREKAQFTCIFCLFLQQNMWRVIRN